MLEIKDPAIKLFGKTIPVSGDGVDSPRESNASSNFSGQHDVEDKELADEEAMDTEQQTDQPDDPSQPAPEESADPPTALETDENQKAPDSEKDSESQKDGKESNDTKNSQQKQIKKPDKILPCPRCNSMDTKFCYYNNYNINQPRHFCKSCQRYWTAGGTMRNVPVGAGRRKNKSSASRYCHITVSEALQAARLDVPNGIHHPGLKTNGTVLTFGTENPLCESMVSVLNIGDKKVLNGATRNGFHGIEQVVQVPCRSKENGDDRSSGSTVTTTSSMEEPMKQGPQEPMKQNLNGFPTQMPCFQWPYVWNPAVPVPPFCPSGFPMPFYPAPYWNGAAIPWNIPWVTPCPPGQTSPGSNPNSPTLGKHSRDGEMLKPGENEKGSGASTVLVPKTLRIDDPDEAAKSSIWTTLGIKKEKGDSTGRGFFNSLHSKGDGKDHKKDASPALKANPAALCRSISFQESA